MTTEPLVWDDGLGRHRYPYAHELQGRTQDRADVHVDSAGRERGRERRTEGRER